MTDQSCLWEYSEGEGAWFSACEDAWTFHEGTPKENGMKFCCFCGKPIIEEPKTSICSKCKEHCEGEYHISGQWLSNCCGAPLIEDGEPESEE